MKWSGNYYSVSLLLCWSIFEGRFVSATTIKNIPIRNFRMFTGTKERIFLYLIEIYLKQFLNYLILSPEVLGSR